MSDEEDHLREIAVKLLDWLKEAAVGQQDFELATQLRTCRNYLQGSQSASQARSPAAQ